MQIKIANTVQELPTKPGQVKLSQALVFLEAYKERYVDFITKLDDDQYTLENNKASYLRVLVHCISKYFDLQESKVLSSSIYITNDSNTVINDFSIIFNQLVNIICDYKPKQRTALDYKFAYNGLEFCMPYFLINSISNEDVNVTVTTAQAIEILEVKRLLAEHKKNNWKGSYYTELVSLTAILARTIDTDNNIEEFPDEQSKIDKYMDSRKIFFKDIDMETAFDITFFLPSIMKT